MSASSKVSVGKNAVEAGTGAEKGDALLKGGTSEPPRLEDVVDLTNTVDTTVHSKQLPAITHEYVTPTVHEILEEKITREIHHHDVFHRIQPIVEVEILPTRHFVPNADDTLREIPASAIPGRQNNWHVAVGPAPLSCQPRSSSDLKPGSLSSTKFKSPLESTEVKPVQNLHPVIHSSDGGERAEMTRRHPPAVFSPTYKGDDHSINPGKDINTHGRQAAKYNSDSHGTSHGHAGNLPGSKEQNMAATPTLRSTPGKDNTETVIGKKESKLRRIKNKLRIFISSDGGATKLKKRGRGDLSIRE